MKLVIFTLLFVASSQVSPSVADSVNYRLPNNTKPESYYVQLLTSLEKGDLNFTGFVSIALKVLESDTNEIILHARNLAIGGVKLLGRFDPIDITFKHDTTTDFLTITKADRPLDKDIPYRLEIEYSGELRTDFTGFYRTSYINAKGETRWLASTRFQPTYARQAFPCYDEPALKAEFSFDIEHDISYNATSNMLIDYVEEPYHNKVTTSFKKTPLMSTYSVAFTISDLQYADVQAISATTATTDNSTVQRVDTESDHINSTPYSLAEGAPILNAITKYLDKPFPLSKIDFGIIEDFKSDDMGDLSLVTLKESKLTFDPAIHVQSRKLDVTLSVANEIGHQWFGNVVSPKWWTYIWLDGGFATLFEAIGINEVHPDWDIWSYFVVSKMHPVLQTDANPHTHPLSHYIEDPSEIKDSFKLFSYSKAASLLRMFMHALGENTFRKGLKYYLDKMSFAAADENDLFASLDKAAKEDKVLPESLDVKSLFGPWSNQVGFPVLDVVRNYQDNSISLSQKISSNSKNRNESWWIPYNFATSDKLEFNDTKPVGWMNNGRLSIGKGNSNPWNNNTWILFNKQQTGYYRVCYDDKNYELLNNELNDGDLNKIHPINRAQILDDLNEFVKSGHVSAKHLCRALTYLKNETSYAPWQVANRVITEWSHKLHATTTLGIFNNIVQNITAPQFVASKKYNEKFLDVSTRNIVWNLACKFGVKRCLDDFYFAFKYLLNGQSPNVNIRGLVIANGILSATEHEIEQLWNYFLNSSSDDERKEIITSLGNIRNENLLEMYLKKSITDFESHKISQGESKRIIRTIVSSGPTGLSLTIHFFKKNFIDLVRNGLLDEKTMHMIARFLSTKNEKRRFVEVLGHIQFMEDLDLATKILHKASYKRILHTINTNIKWQSDDLNKFDREFFQGECSAN